MPKQSHYLAMLDNQLTELRSKRDAAKVSVEALDSNIKQLETLRKQMASGARSRAKKPTPCANPDRVLPPTETQS